MREYEGVHGVAVVHIVSRSLRIVRTCKVVPINAPTEVPSQPGVVHVGYCGDLRVYKMDIANAGFAG